MEYTLISNQDMKPLSILSFFFGVLLTFSAQGQELSAKEIVRKADDKTRGESSYAEFSMTIVRPKWKRSIRMKAWTKGTDYSMTLITKPARDQGTVFLMRDQEIWNWVPAVDRVIKMPPSMMAQSWMGSDFTNDDLVKQSSVVEDYTHRLLGKEEISGYTCYKIEMIPKPEAAVVWGKVLVWISEGEFIQLKTAFYDEDDFLVNTMIGSEVREMGGRNIATRLEMIPEDKPGQKTVMEYENAIFGRSIPESFFSVQNMKKVR